MKFLIIQPFLRCLLYCSFASLLVKSVGHTQSSFRTPYTAWNLSSDRVMSLVETCVEHRNELEWDIRDDTTTVDTSSLGLNSSAVSLPKHRSGTSILNSWSLIRMSQYLIYHSPPITIFLGSSLYPPQNNHQRCVFD